MSRDESKNIYLVGFMGTGKTIVGKLLAKKLERKFVEMDEQIERKEGKRIAELFAHQGEAYFRQCETSMLNEIAKESGLIVSCGGGIVVDQHNREVLQTTGVMVCLTASVDVIYERIKGCTSRPLLAVTDPKREIKNLLAQRLPFYAQAHYTVDTSSLSVQEVVEKVVEALDDYKKNITSPQ